MSILSGQTQLGVRPDLLRRWKHTLEAAGQVATPPIKDYEEAYRRLQRENAQLRQEREFLEKATVGSTDRGGGRRIGVATGVRLGATSDYEQGRNGDDRSPEHRLTFQLGVAVRRRTRSRSGN